MRKENLNMNILFCGNDKVEEGLILSTLSLKNNVKAPLNIYVLTMKLVAGEKTYSPISREAIVYLDAIVKETNKDSVVKLIDITDLYEEGMPKANLRTRFTPYCMLRLFADEVWELPNKILYLDTDVLCREDITSFYEQDMSDCEMGGVLDHYGRWFFRKNPLRSDYINSGVLLMNLDEMRKTGLLKKCREACVTDRMFMPDQSALNKYATSKKICSRKFNEQKKLHDDTVLQHFTTTFKFWPWLHSLTVKPWQIEKMHSVLKLHEYDDLFDEYLNVMPEIMAFKKGISYENA